MRIALSRFRARGPSQILLLWVCGVAALPGSLSAMPPFLEPNTSYLSINDSPFVALDFSNGYFHLEDFENDVFTPGVTLTAGDSRIGASDLTDSVDGDDGNLDGFGTTGGSYFSGSPGGAPTFTFEFNEVELDGLPTHVGLVWTDVGFAPPPTDFFGTVTFEAFDSQGDGLGSTGPTGVGDGFASGQTAEDRFFGVICDGGVSRLSVTMAGSSDDWEIDHLQYGRSAPVPLPAAVLLMLSGLLGLNRYRRTAVA
ncbi:MAG: hypothetical protein O3C28_13105 [Proteobacteria bacterium]|nr:hypothetical protein [Pseudomonadota bacterium]